MLKSRRRSEVRGRGGQEIEANVQRPTSNAQLLGNGACGRSQKDRHENGSEFVAFDSLAATRSPSPSRLHRLCRSPPSLHSWRQGCSFSVATRPDSAAAICFALVQADRSTRLQYSLGQHLRVGRFRQCGKHLHQAQRELRDGARRWFDSVSPRGRSSIFSMGNNFCKKD